MILEAVTTADCVYCNCVQRAARTAGITNTRIAVTRVRGYFVVPYVAKFQTVVTYLASQRASCSSARIRMLVTKSSRDYIGRGEGVSRHNWCSRRSSLPWKWRQATTGSSNALKIARVIAPRERGALTFVCERLLPVFKMPLSWLPRQVANFDGPRARLAKESRAPVQGPRLLLPPRYLVRYQAFRLSART